MIPGKLTRRKLLQAGITVGGTVLIGFHHPSLTATPASEGGNSLPDARQLGLVEFIGEGQLPMETPLDAGLDGRLYTNLSAVNPEAPVTASERFFVRTRASDFLESDKPWVIRVHGQVKRPMEIRVASLEKMSRSAGVHLMECSGNVRYGHFGMMSVADWAGVPVEEVLNLVKPEASSTRVLISGFDRYPFTSATSLPGASWIFALDDLKSAFFATRMNGAPLTRDHGAPVRLVVPGWYGCASVKWIDEIRLMNEDVAATSQMQEFAVRTMQDGIPEMAKDYRPALIDQAAMPVRVEKWLIAQKISYRIVGIAWGGSKLLQRLEIRFSPAEDFVSVDNFRHTNNDPWTIWTHTWSPTRTGVYFIRLRVPDSSVSARRLDAGYYVRSVEIEEI